MTVVVVVHANCARLGGFWVVLGGFLEYFFCNCYIPRYLDYLLGLLLRRKVI